MIAISPKMGEFLTKITQTPDLEAALWQVFNDYVSLKTKSLRETIAEYEQKWGMSFDEFSRHIQEETLKVSPYSWEVEQDFWEWERAETLLRHLPKPLH